MRNSHKSVHMAKTWLLRIFLFSIFSIFLGKRGRRAILVCRMRNCCKWARHLNVLYHVSKNMTFENFLAQVKGADVLISVPDEIHCSTLQHAATHCNTLQHTATLVWQMRNSDSQLATECAIWIEERDSFWFFFLLGTRSWRATLVWQMRHAVAHCNTLQHSATLCNTLQHTATHCNTLLL